MDQYRARCATIGARVRVELESGVQEGQAMRLAADGRLVVETGEGTLLVDAADVVHLRSVPR